MVVQSPSADEPAFVLESEGRNKRIALIEKALKTYSPSGQEGGISALIYGELYSKGFAPRLDDAGNVVCEVGEGSPSLLLCGHMDTVPGELRVEVNKEWAYGRGACDAKGALLSLLFAFEDLARTKGEVGKLIFAGVTDEERNSVGLNELIKDNIRADYAIFGEPGGASKITVGYRGHVTAELVIVTPEVHASAPGLTTNSIEAAYEIYIDVRDEFRAKESNSTERVSVALTEIHAGTAHNVIPGKTSMTVDIRLPFGLSSSDAKLTVEKVVSEYSLANKEVNVAVSFKEPTEAYKVKLDSPLVRAMNRALLKSGKRPTFISKSGTGDMNTYALTFGIDALTYGPGDAKLSHTSEERVQIDELFECARIISNGASELFMITNKANVVRIDTKGMS